MSSEAIPEPVSDRSHPRIATPMWLRLQRHLEEEQGRPTQIARPLDASMLRNTPVQHLFDQALARAREAIPGAQVQSVVLNADSSGRACTLYASFFDPGFTRHYAVRLSRDGAVAWEDPAQDFSLDGKRPYPMVSDLRGMRLSFVQAISESLARYPGARFNWLDMSVRRDGGLDIEAFNSSDWKNEPSVSIDAGVKRPRVTAELWDHARNRFVSDRPRVVLQAD